MPEAEIEEVLQHGDIQEDRDGSHGSIKDGVITTNISSTRSIFTTSVLAAANIRGADLAEMKAESAT